MSQGVPREHSVDGEVGALGATRNTGVQEALFDGQGYRGCPGGQTHPRVGEDTSVVSGLTTS